MPIIYAQYLYWYWYLKVKYWYLYWYLDYWYWYWYLFVEYLIQDWLSPFTIDVNFCNVPRLEPPLFKAQDFPASEPPLFVRCQFFVYYEA